MLLGAPGAGKTTVFKREAERTGGCYVSARNFVTFDDRAEWQDATLYIDGLDEMRAGTSDGRTLFDNICTRLERLGCPRFRLSCREADWLGANDREHLKTVSCDGNIAVLRLDPLSDEGIREMLQTSCDIEDTGGFITAACEEGVDALLANPQSLRMLAQAVAGGSWPQTRMETFDVACRIGLGEYTPPHRAGEPDGMDISGLMDAAGQLCAVQLLTGNAGYALPGHADPRDYPGLDRIPGTNRNLLRHVLGSKLFEVSEDGCVSPVHRQLAEFLAARYLAGLIHDGLPVRRVLALMTGHDGGIVSGLCGLVAWLAAHSPSSRQHLIARAPLATVLYGDVREFSTGEKRWVLEALHREVKRNSWCIGVLRMDARLGDMVTPDMEAVFRDILADPVRDDTRQSRVLILAEMLVHGQPLPGLVGRMLGLLREEAWGSQIKFRIVDALVRYRGQDSKAITGLKELVKDVYGERVSDPDDDLLGYLLTRLYPEALSAQDVLEYLRPPKKPVGCPRYENFWTGILPRNSTRALLAQLLDELARQYDRLCAEVQSHRWPVFFLRRMPLILLSRFLELSREEVEPDRLFGWLGVAAWVGDGKYDTRVGDEDAVYIADWLGRRPEVWKSLFETGLKRCMDSPECAGMPEFRRCMSMEQRRLFEAEKPPDFESWCLDRALGVKDRNAAVWFMGQVAQAVHHPVRDTGLSRETVERRIAGNVVLEEALVARLDELEASRARERASQEVHEMQERQLCQEWHERVQSQAEALRENRAHPELLYSLATAYLGGFSDARDDRPHDRLRRLLGNDQDLVETVLEGFRQSMWRQDLPSEAEVLQLGAQDRIHPLALPFMVGLEEVTQTASIEEIPFDKTQMRLALAIHYTLPQWFLYAGHEARSREWRPAWYQSLLIIHPDAVCDTLIRSTRSRLRNGEGSFSELYELAFAQDHTKIACRVSLPLLEGFRVRCATNLLQGLSYLLKAALLHCEATPLLELIERKLACRGMNMAQRVYWLATGLVVSPGTYCAKLESYVAGHERRVRHLAEFVAMDKFPPALMQRLEAPALEVLIRLTAASCRPCHPDSDLEKGERATPAIQMSERMQGFMNRLACIPSRDAMNALAELSVNERLRPWQSQLVDAAYRQNAMYREASFRHCDVEPVIEVLERRRPASAADLAAH